MALISQAEFARQQGWSRPYVSKLVKKGVIRLKKGKVDTRQALAAIKSSAEPSTVLRQDQPAEVIPAKPDSTQGAVDFVTARTMREAFRAKLAKLEYEQKAGQLTDADKVRNDAFRTGRMIRSELFAIPARMADVLAAEEDPSKIRSLLTDEIEVILNRLCEL